VFADRWSVTDDRALVKWWNLGAHVDVIAGKLGRSRKAVWNRVIRLRQAGLIPQTTLAYQPGGGDTVPCTVCGNDFTRIRITQKICSKTCRTASRHVAEPKIRTDGICPRCQERPRVARPSGRLRSYCRECENAMVKEYFRTEAGKATAERYRTSERGKAMAKAAMQRYRARQK